MEKHEAIKTETRDVAKSLKALSLEIGAAPKTLAERMQEDMEALRLRLELLAGEVHEAELRGELTKEQSGDIQNDLSALAHVLSLVETPQMTSEKDLSSLLDTINAEEKIVEEAPLKPGSLSPDFARIGVYLRDSQATDRQRGFQQLSFPITRPDGTDFYYSSFLGEPTRDCYFTEISFIKKPTDPTNPEGAVIRLKTSEGEIATIFFEKGMVVYINTGPNGTTEKESYSIARMDPFQKEFMEKKREAAINYEDAAENAERNHSTVELVGAHKLHFKKVPNVLDAPGGRRGVLEEKDFVLDVHLPPGIELQVIDDRFVVVRDSRGVGFFTNKQLRGDAKMGGRRELMIRLDHIHQGRPSFSVGLHEDTNYFSDFNDFLAQRMQSVYMVEASDMKPTLLPYQGVNVAAKGPNRDGLYTIQGSNGTLRIDPKTKVIGPGFLWPPDVTSIRPTSDLTHIPANSTARDYLKNTKGAVLLEARSSFGSATYQVATFGTFPDGIGYTVRGIHEFPLRYKGFALAKSTMNFILLDERDLKNTSTVQGKDGKFTFSNVPVVEFLEEGRPFAERMDAGKQNFELALQLPVGIKLSVIDNKYLLLEDERGVGFSVVYDSSFGAEIGKAVAGDQFSGKIIMRLSSFHQRAGEEHRYANFSYESNGEKGNFSDLAAFLVDQIAALSKRETSEKPMTSIQFRGISIQGKGPDRTGNYVINSSSGKSYLVISPSTGAIIWGEHWEPSAQEVPADKLPAQYVKAHEYLKNHSNAIIVREDVKRNDGEIRTNYSIITFGKYDNGGGYAVKEAKDF